MDATCTPAYSRLRAACSELQAFYALKRSWGFSSMAAYFWCNAITTRDKAMFALTFHCYPGLNYNPTRLRVIVTKHGFLVNTMRYARGGLPISDAQKQWRLLRAGCMTEELVAAFCDASPDGLTRHFAALFPSCKKRYFCTGGDHFRCGNSLREFLAGADGKTTLSEIGHNWRNVFDA